MIGGHLHNGGEQMVMYLNNKEICMSKPTYEKETITGMNDCTQPIKVKKGDELTMKSVYDITKHPMFVSYSHISVTNFGLGEQMPTVKGLRKTCSGDTISWGCSLSAWQSTTKRRRK